MENLSTDLRPVEWVPPTTREEADKAVLSLSNDIGLILAQLAEDQPDWCGRTGRSPDEYAAWRRRALFAKVHKEAQLRECKRLRTQWADKTPAPAIPRELLACCRELLSSWTLMPDSAQLQPLATAVRRLADYLAAEASPMVVLVGHPGDGPDEGGNGRASTQHTPLPRLFGEK